MALSIMRNGVPLDQLFGAKGASTAAATGCMQNGTDVNQYILALADGKSLGFASGIAKNGSDFEAIFGIPNTNTPLPINGQTFTASSSSATGNSSASVTFGANNTSYEVVGTSTSGGSVPSASGSIPSGAVSMQISYSTVTSTGAGSVINNASSTVTLTSSYTTIVVGSSSTPPSGDNERKIAVTINFYNSSSTLISTTNITLDSVSLGTA